MLISQMKKLKYQTDIGSIVKNIILINFSRIYGRYQDIFEGRGFVGLI